MAATVLPMPSRRAAPEVGDAVIITRDSKRGHIERIIDGKTGKPALAVVRVAGGFGARCLSFVDFTKAPARRKAKQ